MSQIKVIGLTFAYEGSYDNIFTDVSFQIDTDWKLGFCGRNGRGKTTFLQLLMGRHKYSGTISASVQFEYFPFHVADTEKNTLDILQEIAKDAPLWQLQKELSLLAVGEGVLDRSFCTLSSGEQTKVLLAGLFLRENNFLLIDEPTNHLDSEARGIVARYLSGKAGFILVSHDRMFLDECTDHTLSINKNEIEVVSGNFSVWFHNKQLRDTLEQQKNDALKKEIRRLTATAREKADWSDRVEDTKIGSHQADRGRIGHLAAKAMKRSKAIEQRKQRDVDAKSKLLQNIETADALKIHPQAYHSARLLSMDDVCVSYGGREVFRDMRFTLYQGERLALIGGNGSGKSSVLKLLLGEDVPHTGDIYIGSRLIISYVPQDASFLSGGLSEYAQAQQIDETLFKAILRKLDFSRVQFEKDMRNLSAGQKKKVLIARSLCQRAHVYIWDEPLNYIDVLSRMQIEALILAFEPTLLFVEHDRAFCQNIATQTIRMAT